jgi:hypothetical protein
LNQEVKKIHLDSIKLENKLNELNISITNLFIQIDEKMEKDLIDLQKFNSEK